jgi:hypothetical protein
MRDEVSAFSAIREQETGGIHGWPSSRRLTSSSRRTSWTTVCGPGSDCEMPSSSQVGATPNGALLPVARPSRFSSGQPARDRFTGRPPGSSLGLPGDSALSCRRSERSGYRKGAWSKERRPLAPEHEARRLESLKESKWTLDQLMVLGTMPDRIVGEHLGKTRNAVAIMRRALALDAVDERTWDGKPRPQIVEPADRWQ